jgi:hypothetical protein
MSMPPSRPSKNNYNELSGDERATVTSTTVAGTPAKNKCVERIGAESKRGEKLNAVEIGSVIIHMQSTITIARATVFWQPLQVGSIGLMGKRGAGVALRARLS